MTAPSVNFTIVRNALGNSPPSPANTVCVVGPSSSGTVGAVSGPYAQPNQVTSDNGYGPGPELVAALVAAGLQPLFIRSTTSTAGACSSVTHTGSGVSVMTVSGAAYDKYNVVVTITRAGTVGSDPEPGFTVSLDGGLTLTGGEVRMPVGGTYTIPNTNVQLSFTAAAVVVGDTYTFTSTPPLSDGTALAAGATALSTSPKLAGLVYFVSPVAASAVSSINTALGAFLPAKKPLRAVVESIDISSTESSWMTTIENDFATFTSDLISVAATPILYPSALSGTNFRRSIGFPYILRLASIALSKSAGEVADGALENVTTVYHDEALVPGLDADRFVTATSIPGLTGYYITRPNLMHSTGSDFTEMQYGRIMDEAIRITYNFFVQRLNSRVRLEKAGARRGYILEKDARALESGCTAKLDQGLTNKGDISSAETIVSRNDNISSTKTLTVTVKILPPGFIETVNVTMTFTNPALGG